MAAQDKLSKMKPQVYEDERPAEYFEGFHKRARTKEPRFVYGLVRVLLVPITRILFRVEGHGSLNIPDGPVILAPNHASVMDHFLVGQFVGGRKVRFMAKSQMFSGPMKWIYSFGGVFPVRRGKADEEAFETAKIILGKGGLVLMYFEAGRSRTGEMQPAKPGVGRLALETGAPIVPVAILGSERIRNWRRLEFPKIRVLFGEPIVVPKDTKASREEQQELAEIVAGKVSKLHLVLRTRFAKS